MVIAPASQQAAISRAPTLRPYQHAALDAISSCLARDRSTLVVMATGTGKTVLFAERARRTSARGGRSLILVHRDELIRQAARKCDAVGLHVDIERGSQRASTTARVVIASVQSLKGARLARWARDHFAEIVVDEAHHVVARGYRDILDHFDAAKVLCVTATPDRADGVALGEVCASVAYRYEIRAAIADGYLVPVVARRVVVDGVDLDAVAARAGDLAQDQLARVMDTERALAGQATPILELTADRSTIAFCVDVAHAHKLAMALNARRPGCARAVDGMMSLEERQEILAAHTEGRFQYLTNCDVLTEGYDDPGVSCVVNCAPTKSRGRFVQRSGRGLRPCPERGKRDCLLLELTGDNTKHRLVGPVDCLVGAGASVSDEVRAELDRRLESAQLPLEGVLDAATREVERRAAQLRIAAVVRYHAEHVDPFVGPEDRGALPPVPNEAFEREPASQRQLELLDKLGVTLSHLPPSFTRADAWRLIARINPRVDSGLCSYKAARKLASAGVRDVATLTHGRAKQLLDLLRAGGWRPSAIASEPEVRGGEGAAA